MENVKVINWIEKNDHVEILLQNSSSIKARKIVICAGAWSD